jgi:uncharacterized integral membrane protein
MWKIIALVVILLAFGLGYFIMENSEEKIVVTFYGIKYSTTLGVGLSISFVCGALFMFIVSLISEIRLRNYIRKMKKNNQKLKEDLYSQKNYTSENQ